MSAEPQSLASGDDPTNEEADPDEETDDSDVSALESESESEPGPGDSFIGPSRERSTPPPQGLITSGDDPTHEEPGASGNVSDVEPKRVSAAPKEEPEASAHDSKVESKCVSTEPKAIASGVLAWDERPDDCEPGFMTETMPCPKASVAGSREQVSIAEDLISVLADPLRRRNDLVTPADTAPVQKPAAHSTEPRDSVATRAAAAENLASRLTDRMVSIGQAKFTRRRTMTLAAYVTGFVVAVAVLTWIVIYSLLPMIPATT